MYHYGNSSTMIVVRKVGDSKLFLQVTNSTWHNAIIVFNGKVLETYIDGLQTANITLSGKYIVFLSSLLRYKNINT